MRTINVNEDAFKKFVAINKSRPQDASRATTFDHILYIYEEQKFKPEKGINYPKTLGQIIDADKPHTADELRALKLSGAKKL